MSFEFEYEPSGGPRAKPGGGRRGRSARRGGGVNWVLGLGTGLLGAGVSVAMAAAAGEVRAIGDGGFWRAMAGILAVLFLSLPGFSMYWLARTREQHNWLERRWRPTAIVGLSLASSVGAALWCGYLIAVRIAREWSV